MAKLKIYLNVIIFSILLLSFQNCGRFSASDNLLSLFEELSLDSTLDPERDNFDPAYNVYIDPSRKDGCPGDGSYENPYCTWAQARPFRGGHQYLQRRGTISYEMIRIDQSSQLSESDLNGRIIVGGYGSHPERPIIHVENILPDGLNIEKWYEKSSGIWAYSTTGFRQGHPQILLLDGRRSFGPAWVQVDLCLQKGPELLEWMFLNNEILVCSKENPALVFKKITGMFVPTSSDPVVPISIEGRNNVLIDGLVLEGGAQGAVDIRQGASHIEIRNSIIGKNSAHGVRVSDIAASPAAHIDIHHNLIDSGVRWGATPYEAAQSGEGVYFNQSVTDSRIHHNEIVAWTHNGIYLNAYRVGDPGVTNNLVDHNDIHCGPMSSYYDYCRPFSIDGRSAGVASGNVIFANKLHDSSLGSQVNGDQNYIIGNLCYNITNSRARSYPTGMCFRMQAYVYSEANLFAFNTMAHTADAGVEFSSGNGGTMGTHKIIGNIFYNCAQSASVERRGSCIAFRETTVPVGPQIIKNNLMYNPNGLPVRLLERDYKTAHLLEPFFENGIDLVVENIIVNPLFVDPEKYNFKLFFDSPALSHAPPLNETIPHIQGQPIAYGYWQGGSDGDQAWDFSP